MNPWQIIKSVFSGFLGIRRAAAADDDFARTSLWPYLCVGIVFIVLFIALLVTVVHFVLA